MALPAQAGDPLHIFLAVSEQSSSQTRRHGASRRFWGKGNLAHPIHATRWATSRRLFRLRPRPSWCQRAGAAGRRATEFSGSPRAIPTAAGAGPCLRPVAVACGSQDGDQERSEVVRELNSRLCLPSHVVCWQQDSEFLFSFLLRQ